MSSDSSPSPTKINKKRYARSDRGKKGGMNSKRKKGRKRDREANRWGGGI